MEDTLTVYRKNALQVILSRRVAKLIWIKWDEFDDHIMYSKVRRLCEDFYKWIEKLPENEKKFVTDNKLLFAFNRESEEIIKGYELTNFSI